MKRFVAIAAIALTACASSYDPLSDLAGAQRRLDDRGIGYGVTRVPGFDAYVFQLRFSTSDTGTELNSDPMAAAQAAAPEGCTVRSVTQQEDGAYRADYAC